MRACRQPQCGVRIIFINKFRPQPLPSHINIPSSSLVSLTIGTLVATYYLPLTNIACLCQVIM